MSASAQARVSVVQSIRLRLRMASKRQARLPWTISATQASGEALLVEVGRNAVVGRCLAHQVADKIAASASEHDRHTVVADQRQMLAIAGYQQVRNG